MVTFNGKILVIEASISKWGGEISSTHTVEDLCGEGGSLQSGGSPTACLE